MYALKIDSLLKLIKKEFIFPTCIKLEHGKNIL